MTEINVHFELSGKAAARVVEIGLETQNLAFPQNVPLPVTGDYVAFGKGAELATLFVEKRAFRYTESEVTLVLFLDLPNEKAS